MALTPAEKQRRYRERRNADKSRREKDRARGVRESQQLANALPTSEPSTSAVLPTRYAKIVSKIVYKSILRWPKAVNFISRVLQSL